MNSRERVLAAIEYRTPDRPPLNYFGTPETTAKLLAHLKLQTHEDLLCALGADMRYVAPRYVGPSCFTGPSGFSTGGTDMWGVQWEPVANDTCTYNEVVRHPLAEARTVADVEAHAWPDPDWMSVADIAATIATHNRDEPRAIVLPTLSFFEFSWYLRGLEQFLIDLMENPEIATAILARVTGILKTICDRAIEAGGDQIDIVWSSSDIGMQTGMLLSPDTWRTIVRPWHRQLVVPYKELGFKSRYHTDGAVTPIIDDLIEMGVDLLDPIQPKAPGMNAENLAARFGGRIAFYGGVDTQELLPFGTPEAVEADVLRLIRVLGPSGGYMAAASNAVQPDVPVENILALYRTAREYRYT